MHQKTYRIVYTGIFAVLLAICSWISIPSFIPFTLQTFGVFLTLLLLGGKQGLIVFIVYLLMGICGIPVFSNFGAGPGYLLGATGGYLLGFLLMGLCFLGFEKLFGKRTIFQIIALLLGLFLCYAFGTFWAFKISLAAGGTMGFQTFLTLYVLPFVLPDLGKLILAWAVCKKLRPFLKFSCF